MAKKFLQPSNESRLDALLQYAAVGTPRRLAALLVLYELCEVCRELASRVATQAPTRSALQAHLKASITRGGTGYDEETELVLRLTCLVLTEGDWFAE